MLDALLAYRFGLGRVLSFPIAIGATFYFSNELGWPWYFSYSAGIAGLLIVPVLWVIVLGFLVACRSAIARTQAVAERLATKNPRTITHSTGTNSKTGITTQYE